MTSRINTESFPAGILIVDDNPQNLHVLAKILQENKYEIEFATNGEAALVWLGKRKFDLILLDINMPGMNGFEVCRKIRSNPVLNNVPVIFLSADTDRESILKGFVFGAQDYVTKPFDSRELLVRVRTHLKLKDSLEKLEQINLSLEEKVAERTRQLNEANNKLLDLDKTKTDFLSLISHEIRTPLNGILGSMEILKETVDLSNVSDLFEILDISVKRLERFSLDALLITRLKTKQFEIRKDRICLKDMINEVINEEKNKSQSGNIQFKINNEIIDGIILGEAELVKKCIGYILDNAIKYSPVNEAICISTYSEGQTIICEFKDKGKGFAPGIINMALELFVVGDEFKDNIIGLGLPITKMIMEAHGGNIIIGNNPEGGAFVKMLFQNI